VLQYGSKPKGPPSKPTAGRSEGVDDTASSTASYEGSPVQAGNYYHSHSGTQHHSLHPQDQNPYFSHPILRAVGASPAESPLGQTPSSAAGQANGLAHFAGTSPNEYLYQRSPDRFPFYGPETYAPAAIRG
jgi:hypothetical protein